VERKERGKRESQKRDSKRFGSGEMFVARVEIEMEARTQRLIELIHR